jgi:predicted GNAT family acetyltransferase
MDVTVQHNEQQARYEARLDGELIGQLDYRLDGDRIVMFHTEVDRRHGGQGIAGQLAEAALQRAQADGLRVVPSCSYIGDYVARHPEHRRLVAAR